MNDALRLHADDLDAIAKRVAALVSGSPPRLSLRIEEASAAVRSSEQTARRGPDHTGLVGKSNHNCLVGRGHRSTTNHPKPRGTPHGRTQP
jgi:hypothetical protein